MDHLNPNASMKTASPLQSGAGAPGSTLSPDRRQAPPSSRKSGARKVLLPDLLQQVRPDSHEPIGKQIFRALRLAIFAGDLAPGTPLSEKEVSDMFNVSRQPVREAFIKLVEAGVLQVLPQRGTFVKKISPRAVREGRFIREAIEAAVARKAAIAITDPQLDDLARNLREQKVASKHDDT